MRKSVGDSGQKAQPAAPGVVDDALFHRLIQINRQRGFLQRESRLVCGGLDGVAGKVSTSFLEAAEDLLEELLLGGHGVGGGKGGGGTGSLDIARASASAARLVASPRFVAMSLLTSISNAATASTAC